MTRGHGGTCGTSPGCGVNVTVSCHAAVSRLTRSRRRGRSCRAPDSSHRLCASRRWLRVSTRIVAGGRSRRPSPPSARGRRGGPRSSLHPRHVLGTRRRAVYATRHGRPRLRLRARAVLACGCGLNEAWPCRSLATGAERVLVGSRVSGSQGRRTRSALASGPCRRAAWQIALGATG